MRIKLISDIHTEFERDCGQKFIHQLPNNNVDVLVIAGDLTSKHFEQNLKQFCERFPEVVYVMGNHDYWHSSIEKRHEQIAKLSAGLSNLHWLNNDRVQIGDKFFAGGTLWFPKTMVRPGWPDFRFVAEGPYGIFEEHEKTYKFLNENVQKGDIVVTHHLPSPQCVHPRWEGDPYNCYFVADVEDIMLRHEPSHWFFGHTHDARNLQIWKTHLLCNPRGYPHEGVPFDPDIIIDTELEE